MADEELRALLDDVVQLVQGLGDGEQYRAQRHDLEVLALFARGRGLLKACQLLLREGFSPEAMNLTRPLLTESLVLGAYAAADEKRRVEIAVGWELKNVADLEGVMREAARRGDDDVDGALGALSKRRDDLHGYARRHDVNAGHWQPNEKKLADEQGRGHEYLDFRMTNHFVHGSTFVTMQHYARDDEDEDLIMLGGPAAEGGSWSGAVAGSASQSMLYATRAYCSIVGLEEPPEVAQLLERVEELAGESRDGSSPE